jgi:hypothetical protein
MDRNDIESLIEECKAMASEAAFNLDKGHIQVVNNEKYADLLENLIRTHFPRLPRE